MAKGLLELISAGVLTVVITSALYLMEKRWPPLRDCKYMHRQIIYGLIYGIMAIMGTHFGIDIGGAVTNLRDAAPLCAGFVFGAPAALIAGFIGGIERWLSTEIWGIGEYTQMACTIATILAGILAAVVKKYVFDNRRPAWIYALALATMMEVTHMLLVFLFHVDDFIPAYKVVALNAPLMIPMNALTVGVALLVINRANREKICIKAEDRGIAQNVVLALFVTVVLAFAVTLAFVWSIQSHIATKYAEQQLTQVLDDIDKDIQLAEKIGYDVDHNIGMMVKNRHIGETGGVCVYNEDNKLIGSSGSVTRKGSKIRKDFNEGIEDLEDVPSGVMLEAYDEDDDDTRYYLMKKVEGSHTLIGYYPKYEASLVKNTSIIIMAFVVIFIMGVLFIQIFLIIKNTVVRNIAVINERLARIAAGNLETKVEVRGSEEFISLSHDINLTVGTLKHYIKEAEERIDQELQFAKDIQYSSLNREFPDGLQYELFASMQAAKEVGGDFYDFFTLGDDRFCFMVADVSGKGVPGAMFMMKTKTLINGLADTGASVDTILTKANEELCINNEADMFVTAWIGILDINTNVVTYANAGHNPPIVVKADGRVEYLQGKINFVLAGMEGIKYAAQEVRLEKGDSMFLYTDGITEATNADKELYGEDRLLAEMSEAWNMKPSELCKYIKKSVDQFVGEAPQFDDITMLSLKLKDENEENTELVLIPATESVTEALEYIEKRAEHLNIPVKVQSKLGIIIDELYSNVARYSGATIVKIKCEPEDDMIRLTLKDNVI